MSYKIFTELDEIKSDYEGSSIEIIDGLYFSQYKTLRMCEFYSNSRYLKVGPNGTYNKDLLGRDKPFYNIVNYRVALAKTATDLDIKDIQIISDNPKHQVESMILNREAYEWMKRSAFSLTLNRMGQTRPKYGGYIIKKTEKDGELMIDVVDWNKLYTDQCDILEGAITEEHYMTPVQLKAMDGSWKNIDTVLRYMKGLKGKDKPNKATVYEITGEFPRCVFNDSEEKEDSEDDEFTYSLQHYFIAEVGAKKFLLYGDEMKGKKMTDIYGYLAWEEMPGRGLGKGVIEDSEEAQVWTNDSVVNEKNAMDLAGKVVLKTNSKKLANNVLEVDNGKIFELGLNEDINSFNMVPAALGQFQNQIEKWQRQADNVTSSYNAITGEDTPASQPYSTTALLNQVATKPFDYKREEWGIHLTEIFESWVIPYLIKQIKKKHILVSEYSDQELDVIDQAFATLNANKDIFKEVLAGNVVSPLQQQDLAEGYKKHIQKQGKKRFLEVPDGFFDDIESKVTVLTTGEQKNKAVILQSLNEIMKTVIGSFNPATGQFGVLQDPTLSKIFNEIVELSGTGISPVSIGKGAMSNPPAGGASPVPPPQPVTGQQSAPLAKSAA